MDKSCLCKNAFVPIDKERSKLKSKTKVYFTMFRAAIVVLTGVRAVSFVENEMKLNIAEKILGLILNVYCIG